MFLPIWITLSYFPLAHMVWGGGFLCGAHPVGLSAMIFPVTDGVANVFPQDYAGGTVVHINAGMAGLVLALVIGKRLGFGKEADEPHNLTLTMIGAGLLWFGWFGFNVGSIVFLPATAMSRHRPVHVGDRWSPGSTRRSRPVRRCSAWIAGRAVPRRQGHLARCRLRRGRRPGRDHPVVRLPSTSTAR